MRARRKSPWGKLVEKRARLPSSKTLPPGIQGDRQQGPRRSPTKWVRWGEEESPKGISSGHSGATELLPLKAKRRMWSLRRRGTPFFPIFRRATKDVATGGHWLTTELSKMGRKKGSPCTHELPSSLFHAPIIPRFPPNVFHYFSSLQKFSKFF